MGYISGHGFVHLIQYPLPGLFLDFTIIFVCGWLGMSISVNTTIINAGLRHPIAGKPFECDFQR